MKMRSLLWLLVPLFGSCQLLNPIPDGRCSSSEDCLSNESCQFVDFQSDGFCVGQAEINPLSFAIDITPLPESGFLRTQEFLPAFAGPVLDLGDLPLKQEVKVAGRVVVLGAENSPTIQVTATNQEAPLITGSGREVFVATSDTNGLFTLRLRPGRYDIVATPVDAPHLPPVVLRGLELGNLDDGALILSFDSSRKLRGFVTSLGLGLEGMRVVAHAVDPESGEIDPDIRSSIATTGPDGRFEVALPPDVLQFVFRIEPVAGGPSALVPLALLSINLEDLLPTDGILLLSPIDLGPLESPVVLTGHISGPDANPAAPFKNADEGTSLLFTRVDVIPGRSFSRRVEVDATGSFFVELLPGTYDISVSSPASSELASGLISGVSIDCSGGSCEPLELILERRRKVFGEIFTPGGDTPRGGLTVDARPAGKPQESPVGTISDKIGRGYELLLDPGIYDLTVTPPSVGGLAPWFVFGVDLREADVGADVQLLPSSLLVGRISSPDSVGGMPVPAIARVQVFAQASDGSFYLVNTATTDDLGRFVVVLPNPEGTATDLGFLAP